MIDWDLVNPEGAARSQSLAPAARLTRLAGATVGLQWNGKPGGDHALDELATLLLAAAPDIRLIKYWETLPESVSERELSADVIQSMAERRPDLVIVSQAD